MLKTVNNLAKFDLPAFACHVGFYPVKARIHVIKELCNLFLAYFQAVKALFVCSWPFFRLLISSFNGRRVIMGRRVINDMGGIVELFAIFNFVQFINNANTLKNVFFKKFKMIISEIIRIRLHAVNS